MTHVIHGGRFRHLPNCRRNSLSRVNLNAEYLVYSRVRAAAVITICIYMQHSGLHILNDQKLGEFQARLISFLKNGKPAWCGCSKHHTRLSTHRLSSFIKNFAKQYDTGQLDSRLLETPTSPSRCTRSRDCCKILLYMQHMGRRLRLPWCWVSLSGKWTHSRSSQMA